MSLQTISPQELEHRRQGGEAIELIDVRTPLEFAEVHVEGARSVPLGTLDAKALVTDRNGKPLFVICRSGSRAAKACEALQAAGVENVYNVEGGTIAWEQAGLPVVRSPHRVMSLERQVRIAAGSLVFLGTILGWLVHPGFLALSGFVGAGLVFAGLTDTCGMGLLLAKMPWNRGGACGASCPS